MVKIQVAGPWTLGAAIELARGHRVLTDHGALRDFTASLLDGLKAHVADVHARTGAPVVVQFDEPTLPAVLAGDLSTPSGYGTVPAVPEPEARELLTTVVAGARRSTGQPVIIHCCAAKPPLAMLREAGADGLAFDLAILDGASPSFLDEIGEVWDGGATLFLGAVPGTAPTTWPSLREIAEPAFRLVDRLGFNRRILAERTVPTPACGLAGATGEWMRRALALTRDLGKAFVEPPETW